MPELLLLLLPMLITAGQVNPTVVKYDVVYPENIYTQYKQDVEARYPEVLQYKLNIDGQERVIHLEKTNDLTNNFTETYYREDGEQVTGSPPTLDHCYYQGYIKEEEEDSSASISTCNGLSGFVKIRDQKYGIEPIQLTDDEEHVIYDYASLESDSSVCGVTNSAWNVEQVLEASLPSESYNNTGNPKKMYVELYIVADNSMFQKYGKDFNAVKHRIFESVNLMNMVFRRINIFVSLIGFEVWTQEDLVTISPDISVTLSNFSIWRSEVLLKQKNHDHAQLLTNMDFDGSRVGLAFVGTMCSVDQSAGVIQDYSEDAIQVGSTMAHEMGHSFGMNHDEKSCFCNESVCIMTPILSKIIAKEFSDCSLWDLSNFTSKDTLECTKNRPLPEDIKSTPLCGNGILELGEECDCGGPEECTNPCCDPKTCTLTGESKCAQGECCENCKLKSAGSICRPSVEECDLTDVCDGQSAWCPADKFRQNGSPCKNTQSYCYMGKCPTMLDQCVAEWGQDVEVAKRYCFSLNTKGFQYGYCRKNATNYIPCTKKDMECGKLFCTGGNNLPKQGNAVSIRSCKTSFHPSLTIGVVETGTKCGNQEVCSNNTCLGVSEAYNFDPDCSKKCKGNAVCNNELECQCEEGWASPDCDKPLVP